VIEYVPECVLLERENSPHGITTVDYLLFTSSSSAPVIYWLHGTTRVDSAAASRK
jgi:hypothetical protein